VSTFASSVRFFQTFLALPVGPVHQATQILKLSGLSAKVVDLHTKRDVITIPVKDVWVQPTCMVKNDSLKVKQVHITTHQESRNSFE
jgi:hypothetical protein